MPSKRRLPSSIALACLASAGAVSAVDFAGTGVGPIPDYPNPGRTVTFNVAGIAQPLSDIRLKLSMSHSYIGDLKVVLTSPNGIAHLAIFGRMSDSSNLNGIYNFDDDASYDLWTAAAQAPSAGAVPPGRYRTSSMGLYSPNFDRGKNGVPTEESRGFGLHPGGCVTTLGGAFGGLTPQQANGQWTLQFVDEQQVDVGTISAAVLVLNDGAFASGFKENQKSCHNSLDQ